ncbi:MAG TPA: cadherin repeat domain-containing protein [Candidatus Wirthbacteria bacterium]|nr:cadherin repeat domain-containing protein [Candidatus Wirthbacteria bacterium]
MANLLNLFWTLLTCNITSIGAGATETREITINIPTGVSGNITLQAEVTSDTTDPDTTNNTAEHTNPVTTINSAPTDILLSNQEINEGLPVGTQVGILSTTDPDSSAHTYTLVSGSGSTDNALFSITGNTLRTGTVFEYATRASYLIRVRSTDDGSLSYEKSFTITVRDAISPTGAITINSGATYTTQQQVSLGLTATDNGTQTADLDIRLNTSDNFSGSTWETYTPTRPFTLEPDDGTYTVYYQIRDAEGNLSTIYNASISLDTVELTLVPIMIGINPWQTETDTYILIGETAVTITGQSKPLASLTISLSPGAHVCQTVADAEGAFSCSFSGLSIGDYTIQMQAEDSAGRTLQLADIHLQLQAAPHIGVVRTGMGLPYLLLFVPALAHGNKLIKRHQRKQKEKLHP